MARTITEIKKIITDYFIGKPEIQQAYELTPGKTFDEEFSDVSVENNVFDAVAFAQFGIETKQDDLKAELLAEMAKQKIHSQEWYRQKALGFLFGVPVIDGTDSFDITGLTDDELAAAAIVKQAACIKFISNNGYGILRIKVAADDGGQLAQMPNIQFEALKHYMLRYVVDAGTQVKITTGAPDDLKLVLDIYYDALILSNTGAMLDGSNATPVQDASGDFLQSLVFNGEFVVDDFQRSIRDVAGVKICKVKYAASKYGQYTYDTTDVTGVGLIDEIRIADSGYMRLDSLTINWIAR